MNASAMLRRVSSVGIAGNIVLAAFKLFAGIAGHSSAMLSDAVHSLSDVLATLIALIGVRFSRKEADADHPYGHERFECAASLLLGAILIVTGCAIGYGSIRTIAAGNYAETVHPGALALSAAIVSIAVKEAMFHYTRFYAKKMNSAAFMADAWHHRSDALSSVGSLIGIGGAMLGAPVLEPLACAAICLCILKVGIDTMKDAMVNLLDTSGGEEYETKLRDFIAAQPGVVGVDLLHSRRFGSRCYIDAEISVDGDLRLSDAHEIAEQVHDAVEHSFPDVKHIMIHENPAV